MFQIQIIPGQMLEKDLKAAWAIYLNIDQKFLFDEKKGFEI
jgi:hypothetical protein